MVKTLTEKNSPLSSQKAHNSIWVIYPQVGNQLYSWMLLASCQRHDCMKLIITLLFTSPSVNSFDRGLSTADLSEFVIVLYTVPFFLNNGCWAHASDPSVSFCILRFVTFYVILNTQYYAVVMPLQCIIGGNVFTLSDENNCTCLASDI